MPVTNFILATAGHVDHGKSALVIALTGTDPDRLPEEKARGITIELGFAHLELRCGDERLFRVGVVDVPGHEDFVKNMVAGVGSIDAALLVVAADDGWMPQTEEHLQILGYLGVKRGVVALTKVDLVQDESLVRDKLRERLRDSPLRDAPIISTSVKLNRGLGELKDALANEFASAPPPRDIGKPRLAVDRAFTIKGIGTIVTGTLGGGELRSGQDVVIQPAGIATHIRNLQSHNRDVDVARPGFRVALNLTDIEPRGDHSAHGDRVVARGDVITLQSPATATRIVDVMITRSSRSAVRALKHGAIVQVHHGACAVGARVQLLGHDQLLQGEESIARIRLNSPLFAFVGDRFVIRDWSEQRTLAGGIVLDVNPRPRLESLASACVEDFVRVAILKSTGLPRSLVLAQSNFSKAEIDHAIDRLIASGEVTEAGTLVVPQAAWARANELAGERIDRHHLQHPEQTGLPLTELRVEIDDQLFGALIENLCRNGFERRGASIARSAHAPSLPPNLSAAGEAIRTALRLKPFDPPTRAQLASTPLAYQAMKFLLHSGEVVEVSKELILSKVAYQDAVTRIRKHIQAHGPATVSALKSLLGSSRRIMVPLLEKLDRDGVTLRQGDQRTIK